jgi:hypothetical protein
VSGRWWVRREGPAILVVLLITLLVLAVTFHATRQVQQPATHARAEIIGFGTRHAYDGNRPIVIVKMADGSVRQLNAHRALVRRCRRGDMLHLIARGNRVSVGPEGCEGMGQTMTVTTREFS